MVNDRLRLAILGTIPAICLLNGDSGTYFGIGRATDIANMLADRGIVILGIEGFRCDGKFIEPMINRIADFSSLSGTEADRVEGGRRAAFDILQSWWEDVQFVEFTIDDS